MMGIDHPLPIATSSGCLECQKIWGGINNQDIEVSSGGINASIYSMSSNGGVGGDIYYLGACKEDSITRLAIADVTGHGEAVSQISRFVYESLKAHI
jgi:serine phosphatase RsbU (regulator of sigma subunit)